MTDVKAARRAVIDRFARLRPNGRAEFCSPSTEKQAAAVARGQAPSGDGKVIYPDRQAAEAAAKEFEALDGQPMRAYRCPRSQHGHHHLTVDHTATARPTGAVTSG